MKKAGVCGHFGIGRNLLNGQTVKTKTVTEELTKGMHEARKGFGSLACSLGFFAVWNFAARYSSAALSKISMDGPGMRPRASGPTLSR